MKAITKKHKNSNNNISRRKKSPKLNSIIISEFSLTSGWRLWSLLEFIQVAIIILDIDVSMVAVSEKPVPPGQTRLPKRPTESGYSNTFTNTFSWLNLMV